MTDEDWYLIDELRQALHQVAAGLASPHYAAHVEQRLLAVTDGDPVRERLRRLADRRRASGMGSLPWSFATLGSIVAQLEAGEIRALAVASPKRSALLPDVPTFEESGLRNFRVDSWYGLSAPAGTPDPIVKALNDEAQKILRSPDYATKLSSLGLEPITDSGPEKFAEQIRDDIRMYIDLVRSTNLKVE